MKPRSRADQGERKTGPEAHGIGYCHRCLLPILPGQAWRKYDRGRGACAIGLHEECVGHVLAAFRHLPAARHVLTLVDGAARQTENT